MVKVGRCGGINHGRGGEEGMGAASERRAQVIGFGAGQLLITYR